jgi:hypothetical protein
MSPLRVAFDCAYEALRRGDLDPPEERYLAMVWDMYSRNLPKHPQAMDDGIGALNDIPVAQLEAYAAAKMRAAGGQ